MKHVFREIILRFFIMKLCTVVNCKTLQKTSFVRTFKLLYRRGFVPSDIHTIIKLNFCAYSIEVRMLLMVRWRCNLSAAAWQRCRSTGVVVWLRVLHFPRWFGWWLVTLTLVVYALLGLPALLVCGCCQLSFPFSFTVILLADFRLAILRRISRRIPLLTPMLCGALDGSHGFSGFLSG